MLKTSMLVEIKSQISKNKICEKKPMSPHYSFAASTKAPSVVLCCRFYNNVAER